MGFGIGVGILLFVCLGLAHSCIYDILMHARGGASPGRRSRRLESQRIRVAA